jgi:hypothetical protein
VRDVDHRGVRELLLELADLDAHLHAQGSIEVRQRLIEQEHLGIANDGAADGDALPLAAGQGLGQALQILRQLQLARGGLDLLPDLSLGQALQLERVGHVVEHIHVRIERVTLEHHGDAALARRYVVDDPPVDLEVARGDRLEP